MRRADAEKLIGTKVSAWTAMRGCYTGELIRVIPTSPFRAVIRVETVIELPANRANLIAEGAELEVGGVNIKVIPAPVLDYKASIAALIIDETAFLDRWEKETVGTGRDAWIIKQRREAVDRWKNI